MDYDIVVIGAGPGGYSAAIHAAQRGAKVALIERGEVGGSCLNAGCIPTKKLLFHAHLLQTIKRASHFGIHIENLSFDYAKIWEQKEKTLQMLRKNLENLFHSHQIELFRGDATVKSPTEIEILGNEKFLIRTKKLILATGSCPACVSFCSCDYQKIHDSTSILQLSSLPKSLAILGGGYIGCEFASLFSSFGVKVFLIEACDHVLGRIEKNIALELQKNLTKQGVEVFTKTSLEKIQETSDGLVLSLKDQKTISAELLLVSVGRACSSNSFEALGVKLSSRGFVQTNASMETSIPNVYAVGDMTGKMMLAHVASHEGMIAALNAMGESAQMDYEAIPSVIFTDPEICSVGLSLDEALEKNPFAKSSQIPLKVLGKTAALAEDVGFAVLVFDSNTFQILGAHLIGRNVADLIAEMTLAIRKKMTLQDIVQTIHAHPTTSEIWFEGASLAMGFPLHWPPTKKK